MKEQLAQRVMKGMVIMSVHRLFSSCGKWEVLFVVVGGLLIVVASLAAEHRL